MLNAQLYPSRRVGLDKVHELPRNHAGFQLDDKTLDGDGRNNALQNATHRATQTDIHLGNLQFDTAVGLLRPEIDVVHPHNFAAMDIDDLLVEQVTFQ